MFYNIDLILNIFENITNKYTSPELSNLDWNLNSYISITNIKFIILLVCILPIIITAVIVLMMNSSNAPISNANANAKGKNAIYGNNNNDNDDDDENNKKKEYIPVYNKALRNYEDPYHKTFVQKGQRYFKKNGASPIATTDHVLDENKFLDLKEAFLNETKKNPDIGLNWDKASDLYMCSWDDKWLGTDFNKGTYEEVASQLSKFKFSNAYKKAIENCTPEQYKIYSKMFDHVEWKHLERLKNLKK